MRVEPAPKVEGLCLRPLGAADVDAWYDYLSLPQVVRHTSWNLRSIDELRRLVAWYDGEQADSAIRFAICEAGALIGTIGFHTLSLADRRAELAYDVHPAHWGRGIASACCRAAVAWGLADRGYARVQATALDSNAASMRVLEKCGFEREGLLRRYRIVRGEPRDFWMYATFSTP
jgi:RimJ/RimL family protein N-acetyltransferase